MAICILHALHAQQISTSPYPTTATTQTGKSDVATAVTNTISIGDADNLLSLKETEFDFGKIPQGKPVTHIFEVTNKSKSTLKIADIHASCGCTTPEWEKDKLVAPGEQTKITVGYNAAAEGSRCRLRCRRSWWRPTWRATTIRRAARGAPGVRHMPSRIGCVGAKPSPSSEGSVWAAPASWRRRRSSSS